MKVLLLNGSTRKNGCTRLALSEVAKALNTEGVAFEMYSGWTAAERCASRCRDRTANRF